MTQARDTTVETAAPKAGALDEARRALFRAGVRRRHRRELLCDIAAELDAVGANGSLGDVLGDDPAATAREWAAARGLLDRRLRLAVFVLPALLAGVVTSGAVIVALADAFRGNGDSVLLPIARHSSALLAVYGLTALLAYAAILTTTFVTLRLVGDAGASSTVRQLAVALPVGGLLAALGGVVAADTRHYLVDARTFVTCASTVVAIVLFTVVAARWRAVRRLSIG